MSRLSAWQHFCVDDVCSLIILYKKNLLLLGSPQCEDAESLWRHDNVLNDDGRNADLSHVEKYLSSCFSSNYFTVLAVLHGRHTANHHLAVWHMVVNIVVRHFSRTLGQHSGWHSGHSTFRHRAGQTDRASDFYILIQGHQFRYHLKACTLFPITGSTVVLACCKENLSKWMEDPHFWPLTARKPLNQFL